MDLQNIQDQLNTEFAKDSTKYIFWFDDKTEYEDEVNELQLGNVKVIQSVMGHKNIETTMDIYAEVSDGQKKESLLRLDNTGALI